MFEAEISGFLNGESFLGVLKQLGFCPENLGGKKMENPLLP